MDSALPTQDRLRLALALGGLLGLVACQTAGSIDSKYAGDASWAPRASDAGAKAADAFTAGDTARAADASKAGDASPIILSVDAWSVPSVDAGSATSADDGSPGVMPSCLPTVSTLAPRPAEALLIQDRSAAMAESLASGSSKWAASAAAMGAAVASGSIAWGMMLFPKVGADGDCCQMPTSDVAPEVEVTPSVGSAALLAAFAGTSASGVGRPLARALVQAANYLSARTTSTAKYLVLVAGGEPTCSSDGLCSGASTADFARTKDAVSHAASLLGIPVATVAVGLASTSNSLQPGPTQQLFADLAKLGGMANTTPGQPAYYAASSADELTTALAAIVAQMKSCSFALPVPYDGRAEAQVTLSQVTLSDVRLAQDPTHQDGWDFADAGTSVVLYGKACATARAASTTVSLQLLPSCSIPVY